MKPTISTEKKETAGPGRPTRPHRSTEERDGYLARFEKSGVSAVAFCREHGLCKQTFYNWRQKARRKAGTTTGPIPRFAEVSVAPLGTGAATIHCDDERELVQAEVRLGRARATVTVAELDIKAINSRIRELVK